MPMLHIRRIVAIAVASLAALTAGTVAAQEYPDRPIRLINPYAPGGSTDPVMRAITAKLQEILGQPWVMEYKPGAGTNIGSDFVAKSKPDGYTVLLATTSMAMSPSVYKSLPYDAQRDLTPIIYLGAQPFSLVVNSTLPIRSVAEFLAYARANPGKLNYGSSGNGGAIHLGVELLKSMARIDMVHVPFKGGGPQIQALLAGSIQVMLSPPSNFVQHVQSGRVRIIGIAGTKRISTVDAPTIAESGVPGYEAGVWYAFYAPAGTPRPIIERLNAATNRALQDKPLATTLDRLGMVVAGGSPEIQGRLFKDDLDRWAKVVKDSNIQAE